MSPTTLAAAQYRLGQQYERGDGVQQDLAAAAEYYRLAAAQNHVDAINRLADLWRKGIPPNGRDYEEALRLSLRAASLGSAEGQADAAAMLAIGRGAPKNSGEAFRLFCLAASNGHGYAAHRAGRLLSHGELGKVDYAEARKWFDRAVELGYHTSLIEIGLQYLEGRGRPVDYNEAFHWFERAAREGEDWAQNQVGSMLLNGLGIDRDDEEAVGWFQLAAGQKYPDAFINLGICYLTGRGVIKDLSKAEHYFRQGLALGEKAAGAINLVSVAVNTPDREHRAALLREASATLFEIDSDPEPMVLLTLGRILLRSDNPLRDPARGITILESLRDADPTVLMSLATYFLQSGKWDQARNYLELAVAKNVPAADRYLGLVYLIGLGGATDPSRGAALLANASSARPMELAYINYFGLGVPKDEARARALIREAAERDKELRQTIDGMPDSRLLPAIFQPEPKVESLNPPNEAGDNHPPAIIEVCTPSYPLLARPLELKCDLVVEFIIDELGRPGDIRITGTPLACFANSAISAVARWRFRPAMRNGIVVQTRVSQPLSFNFEEPTGSAASGGPAH